MALRWSAPQAVAAASILAAGMVLVVPLAPAAETPALALCIAAIGLWATGAVREYITAIAFFTVAMLFKVAPAGVIFSGWESAALWLIFGGLVMGVAIRSTGLGERIAVALARSFGTSYWGIISGVTVVGVAMGFLMPSSMGRAVLLMPIALSLADRFGFEPGSKGRIGVVLAAAFGCHVPTFAILPANVPNVVLVGAAETLWQVSFTYGRYLLLHFPILGLLKTAIMIPMIVWLWPDRARPTEAAAIPPISRDEVWLAVLLTLALIGWATDFIHHVSPAWISMVAALVLLLPRIGLIGHKTFSEQINYGSLFYVAGIMGLGALVDKSGLGARLAAAILEVVPLTPNSPAGDFAGLAAVSTVVGLVTTLPGVPAVLTPLAEQMSQASGLSLEAVLNSQVLGFSNPILPYQSAPLVVAMSLGGERLGPAQMLCLLLALATFVILLPLDFLWWQWLGWL